MIRSTKYIAVFGFIAAFSSPLLAQEAATGADNRLLIVNGNNGHVIYDDGRDDLFCVTRRHFVRYNDYGRRIFRRTMRCR